jgi:rare lipoprotein A (peptidoglycan hydrolase)
MFSVKLAASFAGLLLMSSVTVNAMRLEDPSPPAATLNVWLQAYEGLKGERPGQKLGLARRLSLDAARASEFNAVAGLTTTSIDPRAVWFTAYGGMKLERRPRNLAIARTIARAPVHRLAKAKEGHVWVKAFAGTKLERRVHGHSASSMVPQTPRQSIQDRPRPVTFRPITKASIELLTPLGFAEFCAEIPDCDMLSFFARRAVMKPVKWDENRLLAYVNTAANFSRVSTPHLHRPPARWQLSVLQDHCNLMSLPKQAYLECLGLPAGMLKNKPGIASPMFTRAGLIPRGGGHVRVGKPYKISNREFRPRVDPNYDRTGTASWYGSEFHRRMTANGEWFDMEYFSAAHPTMPLPSYARVINLNNGREMIVRVNDRGPFVGRRIIDVSMKCAEKLQFKRQGTAKVRVQYIGPAPLDDRGGHLAAMNHELERGTPLDQIIAAASGLRQQHAMIARSASSSFTE